MITDTIYAYIAQYYYFPKFEDLGTTVRTYTPYEQASYIASDMEQDPHNHFNKAVIYIRSQLEHSSEDQEVPRDSTMSKLTKTITIYQDITPLDIRGVKAEYTTISCKRKGYTL